MELNVKEYLYQFEKKFFKLNTALIVTNGKFNPPTKAHEDMIRFLFEKGAEIKMKNSLVEPIIMIFTPPKNKFLNNNLMKSKANANTRKKVILDDEDRVLILNKICDNINRDFGFNYLVLPLNFMCLKSLYKEKHKSKQIHSLKIIVGSDRDPSNPCTWSKKERNSNQPTPQRLNNIRYTNKYGNNRKNNMPVNNLAKHLISNPSSLNTSQYSSSLFRELIKRRNNNFAKSILAKGLNNNNRNRISELARNRINNYPRTINIVRKRKRNNRNNSKKKRKVGGKYKRKFKNWH